MAGRLRIKGKPRAVREQAALRLLRKHVDAGESVTFKGREWQRLAIKSIADVLREGTDLTENAIKVVREDLVRKDCLRKDGGTWFVLAAGQDRPIPGSGVVGASLRIEKEELKKQILRK